VAVDAANRVVASKPAPDGEGKDCAKQSHSSCGGTASACYTRQAMLAGLDPRRCHARCHSIAKPLNVRPGDRGNLELAIRVEALADKEAVTTFYNRQGIATAQGVNGALAVRLTNTTTGKRIDLNIPGPARIEPETNKEIIMGPWLLFNTPGLPSNLELTHRRLEFLVDPITGNFTIGTMDDVCPSLS
jgi:hypothetical protein